MVKKSKISKERRCQRRDIERKREMENKREKG